MALLNLIKIHACEKPFSFLDSAQFFSANQPMLNKNDGGCFKQDLD
jgi:hypothetical protein